MLCFKALTGLCVCFKVQNTTDVITVQVILAFGLRAFQRFTFCSNRVNKGVLYASLRYPRPFPQVVLSSLDRSPKYDHNILFEV